MQDETTTHEQTSDAGSHASDTRDDSRGQEDASNQPVANDPMPPQAESGADASAHEADAMLDDSTNSGAAPFVTACPEEDAAACPASDPLCYWESGPGGSGGGGPEGFYSFFVSWSVCTHLCETDADCLSDAGQARCVESGRDHICLFECSFGRSCPGDELSCSNGQLCGVHSCDCMGAGCDDSLCLDTFTPHANTPEPEPDHEGLVACPTEDASVCPASDPLCYYEYGPAGFGSEGWSFIQHWSVCTHLCESDADCVSDLGQGSCVESGRDHICLFDCSLGRSCPGSELSCSQNKLCGIAGCECEGAGCSDPLCVGD